jgi:hypothetical protein
LNKLWSYNKYKFFNDNIIKEYSEFNQYQLGIDVQNPFGPSYGWSIDPGLSIYGTDQDSPYVDYYSRLGGSIARLMNISKKSLSDIDKTVYKQQHDLFVSDLDSFSKFKILRIFKNHSLYLDIFISFNFEDDEFFGVFKNFNWSNDIEFKTELYEDPRFQYIDFNYKLKLTHYVKNKLDNWFKPSPGVYRNLKKDCPIIDDMGVKKFLKEQKVVEVLGSVDDKNGNPHITLYYNKNKYYIKNNDYFFFNYWFEKI